MSIFIYFYISIYYFIFGIYTYFFSSIYYCFYLSICI